MSLLYICVYLSDVWQQGGGCGQWHGEHVCGEPHHSGTVLPPAPATDDPRFPQTSYCCRTEDTAKVLSKSELALPVYDYGLWSLEFMFYVSIYILSHRNRVLCLALLTWLKEHLSNLYWMTHQWTPQGETFDLKLWTLLEFPQLLLVLKLCVRLWRQP